MEGYEKSPWKSSSTVSEACSAGDRERPRGRLGVKKEDEGTEGQEAGEEMGVEKVIPAYRFALW